MLARLFNCENKLKSFTFIISLFFFYSSFASSDERRVLEYLDECHRIVETLLETESQIPSECFSNYHHFNSKVSKYFNYRNKRQVKIASFNLLHPGARNTIFKDIELLAKIINKFDLVAVQELLPVVSRDKGINEKNLELRKSYDDRIETLVKLYKKNKKLETLSSIDNVRSELKELIQIYKIPQYIEILKELMKIDKSWSLILSPAGDASEEGSVQEQLGFFYRGSIVKNIANEHCEEFKDSKSGYPSSCFPNFQKGFWTRTVRNVFSRRPFMSSFKSGKFDFTLLNSHVVYGSSSDPAKMKSILKPSFDVDSYLELGTGVTRANYARFAEYKVTLDLVNLLKDSYNEKDIIYLGDFNLESSNQFMKKLMNSSDYDMQLYNTEASTISLTYSGPGDNGEGSDYDHIVLSPNESRECVKNNDDIYAKVLNFYTDAKLGKELSKYVIRNKARSTQDRIIEDFENRFESRYKDVKTVTRGQVQSDFKYYQALTKFIKPRIFDTQLDDRTYFRVFRELVSDHLPVHFSCDVKARDDD